MIFNFIFLFMCVCTVCSFPYIIAFTTDTMEIRLIINGNLVQTMAMPKLKLICSKVRILYAQINFIFHHFFFLFLIIISFNKMSSSENYFALLLWLQRTCVYDYGKRLYFYFNLHNTKVNKHPIFLPC